MRRLAAATITTVLAVCLLAPPAAAYPRPGKTLRVNPLLDLTGGPASGGTPQLSGDGRHVLFPTTARLVEDDTGLAVDCYVRDLVTWSLVRASVAHDGTEANGSCSSPAISRDGRYVAWHSTATNLVPGDTNGLADIFVRDLVAGTTTRASVSAQGAQADGASTSAAISDDGRVVAFLSSATNLVAGDSNAFNDVFVRNMEDGSIQIATLSTEGTQGVTAVSQFELSGNGRHVVFVHRMPWEGDKSSYD
ncbi:MAG TPA: hypothetical protein VM638_02840, partial [Actinomycetota bacterium]|nr:hypothetical protein [Actinomycetota bacterium]